MGHHFFFGNVLDDFEQPENRSAKIWRFMTFAKYISLLETRSIFFTRADILAKEDPLEGSSAHGTVEAREKFLSFAPRRHRAWMEKIKSALRDKTVAQSTYISCWHLNEYESQGMWKLYTDGPEGLAIQSQFDALETCLKASVEEICIGCIHYIDFTKDKTTDGFFRPFYQKSHAFRHECEVRAIIFPRGIPEDPPGPSEIASGRRVKVDLGSLIKAVHISPFAPSWFQDLVISVTRRYGLDVPIKPSALREVEPIY